MKARAWFLLLLLSGSGCVLGVRDDLLGFPAIRSDTPAETADRALEIIRNTERRIRSLEEERAAAPWKRAAWLRLMDVYVALSNDELGASTGLDPQGTTTRRPPLYLYPRVTAPLVAEASDAPDGLRAWILPVILNREAFERPRTADAWLGTPLASLLFAAKEHELDQSGNLLYEKLQRHFRFMLVPRDRGRPEEIILDGSPDRYVSTRAVARDSSRQDVLQLREDAIEILFRLPTSDLERRWKREGADVQDELFDLRMSPAWRSTLPASPAPGGASPEALFERPGAQGP